MAKCDHRGYKKRLKEDEVGKKVIPYMICLGCSDILDSDIVKLVLKGSSARTKTMYNRAAENALFEVRPSHSA